MSRALAALAAIFSLGLLAWLIRERPPVDSEEALSQPDPWLLDVARGSWPESDHHVQLRNN